MGDVAIMILGWGLFVFIVMSAIAYIGHTCLLDDLMHGNISAKLQALCLLALIAMAMLFTLSIVVSFTIDIMS